MEMQTRKLFTSELMLSRKYNVAIFFIKENCNRIYQWFSPLPIFNVDSHRTGAYSTIVRNIETGWEGGIPTTIISPSRYMSSVLWYVNKHIILNMFPPVRDIGDWIRVSDFL